MKDDGSSTDAEIKACLANLDDFWMLSNQEYDDDMEVIEAWYEDRNLESWWECIEGSYGGDFEYEREVGEDGTFTGECSVNQEVVDCNNDPNTFWLYSGGCYTAEEACKAHADQGFVWGNDGNGDYCTYKCLEAPALAHDFGYETYYTLSGCS